MPVEGHLCAILCAQVRVDRIHTVRWRQWGDGLAGEGQEKKNVHLLGWWGRGL